LVPADRPSGNPSQDARVGRTRADVSRAALQVLVEEGCEALSHAHLAEIAGYSKTTLYAHWPARLDLIMLALDALGEMPHNERSGNLRADIIGELQVFRQAVTELRLDHILSVMAQWASVDEMAQVRDRINSEGQGPLRVMLTEILDGAELDAAVSMLTGVVACPSLMFGTLPGDEVIEAAVGLVLSAAGSAD
jgi:AcrR family transcriptional regulator